MNASEVEVGRPSAIFGVPALRTGLITGGLLVLTMLTSLFLANRVPALESSAWIRNDLCRIAFGLVMLIPVFRFCVLPRRMFASALLGWVIFAAGYEFAGMYFSNLFTCLGRAPFQALVLGIVFYGVVAVVCWVAWMVADAAHEPALPARRIHTTHRHQ